MRKHVHQTLVDGDIRLDFRLELELRRVKHFCINVSLISEDRVEDVFRVDTAHEGLHVQKFWISQEPKYLESDRKEDYIEDFLRWKTEVLENFETWVKAFRKIRGG